MSNNHSYLGNPELLKMRKVGFLASRKISSLSVLPTFDWAVEISKHEDIVVVSGFSSHLEKKVLDFLLKGKCQILLVLARSQYNAVPKEYVDYIDSGRMTIISVSNSPRQSRATAHIRNKYIAEICDEIVFPIEPVGSSLYEIFENNKQKSHLLCLS